MKLETSKFDQIIFPMDAKEPVVLMNAKLLFVYAQCLLLLQTFSLKLDGLL